MSAVGKEKTVGKLKFFRENTLGHGSYGTTVFKGMFENTISVAIKRVDILRATVEIDILRRAHIHPNIVNYYITEFDDDF